MPKRAIVFAALVGAIGGCGEPTASRTQPTVLPPSYAAEAPQRQEEEIIGDGLLGETVFIDYTGGGPRARYFIDMALDQGADMYVFATGSVAGKWGYYSAKVCPSGEQHDVNGDTEVNEADGITEHHCLPSGEYTMSLKRVYWSSSGTRDSMRTLFTRKVALLDRLGGLVYDPTAPNDYHDVHVRFDLTAAVTTLPGNIRAGDYFDTIATTADWYPPDKQFTIGSGDTLWLISTYHASGNDGRPWYDSNTGVLTAFHPDFDRDQNRLTGGVNSVPTPQTYTMPMLQAFDGSGLFRVVGRVVEPYHPSMLAGRAQTDSGLSVTVVGVGACYTYSSNPQPGQPVTFDARCSAGFKPLDYRWSFGDGTPVTDWAAPDTVVQHTFATNGTYSVRLEVRRFTSTAPTDDTTRSVQVGASPLGAAISGPDQITVTGSYEWHTAVSGGAPPYHYRWYYYRWPGPEQPVGSDSPDYARYVSVKRTDAYLFRLTDSVSDGSGQRVRALYFVEVTGGGGGAAALTTERVRYPDGSCRPRPPSGPVRQAWLAEFFLAGRAPQLCTDETLP